MKKVIAVIKTVFSKEFLYKAWVAFRLACKSSALELMADPQIRKEATQLVKDLMSADMTADQKKEAFDKGIRYVLANYGKYVGSSTVNSLREMVLELVETSK